MKILPKTIILILSFSFILACTFFGAPQENSSPSMLATPRANSGQQSSGNTVASPTSRAAGVQATHTPNTGSPTKAPAQPTSSQPKKAPAQPTSPPPTNAPAQPTSPPPPTASSGNDPVTITNVSLYPENAVYYGNCTTEETLFSLQASIGPDSQIASATMYYAYTGQNGTFGNYSVPMTVLGIGDYSGVVDVGAEADYPLGTGDGSLDAYINVVDVNGNSTDSNWVSIPVFYCTTVGPPPQQSTISKGSGTLYNNFSLDLGDGDGDDVIFSHTSGDVQLLSVWGTALQVNLYADVTTCKSEIDNGNTFTAVTIEANDVVCYKTGSGNYGYLVVDGLFLNLDNHDDSYADLSYETEVMP